MEDDKLLEQLEEGLQINENALDKALMVQSDLFYRVARTLALRISQRDAAKQSLEEIEAQVDIDIRHRAQVHDEKVTETGIKSMKALDKRVKEANQKLIQLNQTVGQFSALKEAFIQRSYVLKSLGDLYVAGYFADASTSNATNIVKDAQAQMTRRILNERRRASQ